MRSYLYSLTRSRRDVAIRVLEKAENYLPVILESLHARGLPAELACLPMVESAFEPKALSPAGAAGLWQLMPETARRFGLTVNSETDERFDLRKSTAAAAAYLAALHALFKDWPLALAAYNCGEGAMRRALSETNSLTLPELARACRLMGGSGSPLARETLRFVPQFAAAVQIMTNSRAFGLTDHALLQAEPRSASVPDREPPLTLVGHYGKAPESGNRPARSRRLP
jgi:soluble lytic murein transglycosylase-like protein